MTSKHAEAVLTPEGNLELKDVDGRVWELPVDLEMSLGLLYDIEDMLKPLTESLVTSISQREDEAFNDNQAPGTETLNAIADELEGAVKGLSQVRRQLQQAMWLDKREDEPQSGC